MTDPASARLETWVTSAPEAADLPAEYGTDSGAMIDDIRAVLAEVRRLRSLLGLPERS